MKCSLTPSQQLERDLLELQDGISIRPRRLVLSLPNGSQPSVTVLRGLWGSALYLIDKEAYQHVYKPNDNNLKSTLGIPEEQTEKGEGEKQPKYVLRTAHENAFDWVLIGKGIDFDQIACRAWDMVGGMGLGPENRRHPFAVSMQSLQPQFQIAEPTAPRTWRLSQVTWPAKLFDSCRLDFKCLSLNRKPEENLNRKPEEKMPKKLLERPTFSDLIHFSFARLKHHLPASSESAWDELKPRVMQEAERNDTTSKIVWRGQRADILVYDQKQKISYWIHAVRGSFTLPAGPGPLWPLLAAAQWMQLGKGKIHGLGSFGIYPNSHSEFTP